jgi:predicted nucleic-acid-binding Zn-ribbon protein
MKCPKCNSENVQIQAKEFKPKFVVGACLTLGGIGLVFLGIPGGIIGAGIGAVVGAILDSLASNTYHSVMVCQDCGYTSKPLTNVSRETVSHPLFCDSKESNLDVIRNDIAKGTIIIIRVKIDNYAPFDIADNQTINLKVPDGEHTISYEQINGIGKDKNKGQLSISVNEKKSITFSFSRQGLIVK